MIRNRCNTSDFRFALPEGQRNGKTDDFAILNDCQRISYIWVKFIRIDRAAKPGVKPPDGRQVCIPVKIADSIGTISFQVLQCIYSIMHIWMAQINHPVYADELIYFLRSQKSAACPA